LEFDRGSLVYCLELRPTESLYTHECSCWDHRVHQSQPIKIDGVLHTLETSLVHLQGRTCRGTFRQKVVIFENSFVVPKLSVRSLPFLSMTISRNDCTLRPHYQRLDIQDDASNGVELEIWSQIRSPTRERTCCGWHQPTVPSSFHDHGPFYAAIHRANNHLQLSEGR
jgi:hypothetical protein